MVPAQDLAPPSFLPAVPRWQTDRPTLQGVGTGEPPLSYGAVDRSINSGVPSGMAGGLFLTERFAARITEPMLRSAGRAVVGSLEWEITRPLLPKISMSVVQGGIEQILHMIRPEPVREPLPWRDVTSRRGEAGT
jgi:hypothetical protein